MVLSPPPPSLKEMSEGSLIQVFVTHDDAKSMYLPDLNIMCGPGNEQISEHCARLCKKEKQKEDEKSMQKEEEDSIHNLILIEPYTTIYSKEN